MKKILSLAFVGIGFTLATVASSSSVQASSTSLESQSVAPIGGCVGSGACGTTSQGTQLYGKWREQ